MSEKLNHDCDKKDKACRVIGYQNATVLAPIKVKPKVKVHDPKTFCFGKPVVVPGFIKDHDKKDCEFTVAQKIVIAVPIEIKSDAFAGEPSIKCGCSESKDSYREEDYEFYYEQDEEE